MTIGAADPPQPGSHGVAVGDLVIHRESELEFLRRLPDQSDEAVPGAPGVFPQAGR